MATGILIVNEGNFRERTVFEESGFAEGVRYRPQTEHRVADSAIFDPQVGQYFCGEDSVLIFINSPGNPGSKNYTIGHFPGIRHDYFCV
jgi:hypothetical protein